MASHNHAYLILLQELVNNVRAIRHYIILLLRVTHCISLHTLYFVRSSWVTPHDVHAHLLDRVSNSPQGDSKRSLDLVNVLKLYY